MLDLPGGRKGSIGFARELGCGEGRLPVEQGPHVSSVGWAHEHPVAVGIVPLRQSLRTEDVGGSVPEQAGWNPEWSVPKALVFTPSADLEIGPGAQEIDEG